MDDPTTKQATADRFSDGLLWGVLATIAMSVLMLAATAIGLSPMPEPVPKAIAAALIGGAPMAAIMILAIVGHLAYGGLWAGLLAVWRDPIGWAEGIGLGVGLWGVMGVAVLPVLGWGLFGTGITPRIAVATLVLHLVYGLTLGWVADRGAAGSTGVGQPT